MSTDSVHEDEIRPLLGSVTVSASGSHTQSLRQTHSQTSAGGSDFSYRVYPWRWYILGVLALLNICNGLMWISFSPIADDTAEFYKISATKVNMLSVVFMIACIPLGLVSIWLLDVWGLRSAILLSAVLNCVGSGLRVVSCLSMVPFDLRYPLLLGGQIFASLAQPLVMFTPTKIAAVWFPANQRALANSIATVSNPLGIMVGNLVSPALVKQPSDIPLLMYIYSIIPVLSMILAVGGVCSSTPPTPPSSSAAVPSETFLNGLKKLMVCGSYWILTLSFGTSVALFTVMNTLVEQILCPLGYSDTFAGWCGALSIAIGLVGAGCAAIYVDKTHRFDEVAKCGLCIATLAVIGFLIMSRYGNMQVALIILTAGIGFFGFASNPICLELSAECTYPIAEATSAGMLLISGQVQSLLLVFMMELTARPFDLAEIPRQTCHTTGVMGMAPKDYTVPNMVLCIIGAITTITFTLGYKPRYKRMEAERCLAAEQIINSAHCQRRVDPPIRIAASRSGRSYREAESGSPSVPWAESDEPQPSPVTRFGQSHEYGSDAVHGSGSTLVM